MHSSHKRRLIPFLTLLSIALLAPITRAAPRHATLSATVSDNVVHLHVVVDEGFHAQSHTPLDESLIPLSVKMDDTAGVTFDPPNYPPPSVEDYPLLGKVSVYTGAVTIDVPFHLTNGQSSPPKLTGTLRLQICNSNSCFPPQKLPFTLGDNSSPTRSATTAPTTSPTTAPAAAGPAGAAPAAAASPPHLLGFNLTADAYGVAFIGAFVVGIIFNVMPCVLPVVPLKIMGFYEVSQHDRRKSVALGAVFSAGLIASFGVLGLLIAALHVINWGGLFQQTWFTVIIVGVLVVMSFSLFGAFTVGLPSGVYRFTPRHDTYGGNFLFGVLTAALSTPCTFGMFVGLLTWALAQPATIGVALIMTVGVGMAFPYFVLSAFPQIARNFPRTGQWADVVKQMMGFLLLATAVYFAQPLLARFFSINVFWWAMFGVIAIGAIFLVIRALQITDRVGARIVAALVALLATTAALWGAIDITSRPYEWTPYDSHVVDAARASGRPVMIDFTATWCGNCHYLEAFVLKDKRVVNAVKQGNVLAVQADVSYENSPAVPLLQQLTPTGAPPLTVVYLPNAQAPRVLDGIYSVDDLVKALQ